MQRNAAKLVQVKGAQYEVNRGATEDQARALLEAARGTRLHALFVLALYLGLRRGEVLGLKWEDIDWAENTVQIRRTRRRWNVCWPGGLGGHRLRVHDRGRYGDRAGQPELVSVAGPGPSGAGSVRHVDQFS
ncbi:tyrosine-type recombinase/integrase [Kribbella sp. CA-245084]|uniref:tyrosine-type recombinase/integrase n=1 Tax=Kribbella sp. CA-245084 TaxID=3239940 RepID=UPI003D8EA102